ncbi:MAG: hypothetical protein AAF633_19640, partial [Chloroflexota bacterium]
MSSAVQTLYINTIGELEIRLGDEQLPLKTAKTKALLVYLALTGQPHSRETLIGLLWGELPDNKARWNLTTTLSELRKAVGLYIKEDGGTLAFDQGRPHRIDITLLETAYERRDLNQLKEGISLVRGGFLAGFRVKNGLAFEAWVEETAART